MWDLAVREEDYSGVDAMLARYRGRPPLSLRLLPAAARSDTAAMRALLDVGRALESRQLQIAGRYAASYLEDFALADSLARLDLQWRERPANRAAAQLLLAGLAAASGRWSAAREVFRTAATIEGTGTPLVQLAMAATLPLQPVPSDDLRTIHQAVTQWDPSATQSGPSLTTALQPHLRHYLLGLLSSRMGDHQAAERAANAIENLPAPPRGAAVAASLAATVRADVAWMQNRHRDILPTLDRATPRIPLELIAVSRAAHVREYGFEHARYLRAIALGALGRDSEALTWLRFGLRGAPQEYLYHAPIHVGLGNVFERLGHADSAAHHYRRFLELWSRADSAALPVVSDVRRRLAPIDGNSSPPRRSGFD
jgi:tetratricopeptide (TPR) repeat protein